MIALSLSIFFDIVKAEDSTFYIKSGMANINAIKDEKNIYLQAKVTPTFIFLEDSNEKGRITGYSYPEMFWWQVDEILER